MNVGFVGVGAMGLAMAGHVQRAGFTVIANDVDAQSLAAAAAQGMETCAALADLGRRTKTFVVVVATDEQSETVTRGLIEVAEPGSVIAIAATNNPATMRRLAEECAAKGVDFVDAPVVYGQEGARQGNLVSLCGGKAEAVEHLRPVLMGYSRDVIHVGPVGAGQIAKSCNNLLHWIHSVGNYEALLLAKRYGIDAQKMREVLLKCPGKNGTLERWDATRFTWQQKDMDVIMDLAQDGGLVLPLTGQTDQLVKLLSAAMVKELLYGPEAEYLGRTVRPLTAAEGGLG